MQRGVDEPPLPFLEKNFEWKLDRKDEFNVEWFHFNEIIDPVKLEVRIRGAKGKYPANISWYIWNYLSRERIKRGINTRSFSSRIIFVSQLINYSTISYVYFSLSLILDQNMHEITKMVKFIGETEFTRANSSTLMSIVRGLITRVRLLLLLLFPACSGDSRLKRAA